MKVIMPKVVDAMYDYVDDHVDIQNIYSDLSQVKNVVAIKCCKFDEYIITVDKQTKKQVRAKAKDTKIKVYAQDIKRSIMDITLCGIPTLTNQVAQQEQPMPVTFFLRRTLNS